jgi:hypothetical protein
MSNQLGALEAELSLLSGHLEEDTEERSQRLIAFSAIRKDG